MSQVPSGEVDVFELPSGEARVEVRLDRDTVWLSLDQMAGLFERDKSVLSRHLSNIFRAGELDRMSVVAKNATTAADGRRTRSSTSILTPSSPSATESTRSAEPSSGYGLRIRSVNTWYVATPCIANASI